MSHRSYRKHIRKSLARAERHLRGGDYTEVFETVYGLRLGQSLFLTKPKKASANVERLIEEDESFLEREISRLCFGACKLGLDSELGVAKRMLEIGGYQTAFYSFLNNWLKYAEIGKLDFPEEVINFNNTTYQRILQDLKIVATEEIVRGRSGYVSAVGCLEDAIETARRYNINIPEDALAFQKAIYSISAIGLLIEAKKELRKLTGENVSLKGDSTDNDLNIAERYAELAGINISDRISKLRKRTGQYKFLRYLKTVREILKREKSSLFKNLVLMGDDKPSNAYERLRFISRFARERSLEIPTRLTTIQDRLYQALKDPLMQEARGLFAKGYKHLLNTPLDCLEELCREQLHEEVPREARELRKQFEETYIA